jgi:hypothetical protein
MTTTLQRARIERVVYRRKGPGWRKGQVDAEFLWHREFPWRSGEVRKWECCTALIYDGAEPTISTRCTGMTLEESGVVQIALQMAADWVMEEMAKSIPGQACQPERAPGGAEASSLEAPGAIGVEPGDIG